METRTGLRRVMMKDENGDTVPVDLDELRRDRDEWGGVISLVFMIESMTTTTRGEFDRLPAKYVAIARTVGADRQSREMENQENLFRLFGAI